MNFFRKRSGSKKSNHPLNKFIRLDDSIPIEGIQCCEPSRVLPYLYLGSLEHSNLNRFTNAIAIDTRPWFVPLDMAKRITFCHLELRDSPTEDIKDVVEEAVAEINAARAVRGAKILVHSHPGSSQATTIVAAYLMREEKMSLCEALRLIESVRPILEPNPGFMRQLENMEAQIKKEFLMQRRQSLSRNLRTRYAI